jgi:hypothetical protein
MGIVQSIIPAAQSSKSYIYFFRTMAGSNNSGTDDDRHIPETHEVVYSSDEESLETIQPPAQLTAKQRVTAVKAYHTNKQIAKHFKPSRLLVGRAPQECVDLFKTHRFAWSRRLPSRGANLSEIQLPDNYAAANTAALDFYRCVMYPHIIPTIPQAGEPEFYTYEWVGDMLMYQLATLSKSIPHDAVLNNNTLSTGPTGAKLVQNMGRHYLNYGLFLIYHGIAGTKQIPANKKSYTIRNACYMEVDIALGEQVEHIVARPFVQWWILTMSNRFRLPKSVHGSLDAMMNRNLSHSLDNVVRRVKDEGVWSKDVMLLRVTGNRGELRKMGIKCFKTNKHCLRKKHTNDCKGVEFTAFRLLEQWITRIHNNGQEMEDKAQEVTNRCLSESQREEMGTDFYPALDIIIRNGEEDEELDDAQGGSSGGQVS